MHQAHRQLLHLPRCLAQPAAELAQLGLMHRCTQALSERRRLAVMHPAEPKSKCDAVAGTRSAAARTRAASPRSDKARAANNQCACRAGSTASDRAMLARSMPTRKISMRRNTRHMRLDVACKRRVRLDPLQEHHSAPPLRPAESKRNKQTAPPAVAVRAPQDRSNSVGAPAKQRSLRDSTLAPASSCRRRVGPSVRTSANSGTSSPKSGSRSCAVEPSARCRPPAE